MRLFKQDRSKRQFVHEKNVKRSLEILEATIDALDRHGIQYYLDYGTLLGAVREKGFIPWDDDMDISLVDEKDYPRIPEVLADLKGRGFKTSAKTLERSAAENVDRGHKELGPDELNFAPPNSFRVAKVRHYLFWKIGDRTNCLDIFFKYANGDTLTWMAVGKVHGIDKSLLAGGLEEIDFYHLKCKIPKNYDAYLASMYGDWQTPKEDWQYYQHDTCSIEKS